MRKMREILNSSDNKLDCEIILRERNDWVLNESEFNAKQEFEYFLENNTNNESFIYPFIKNRSKNY